MNSEVGICHALSYGLSTEFGIRHGLANCIVFQVLHDFYGSHVNRFVDWLVKYDIKLPVNFAERLSDAQLERMIDQTLLMERPLLNALGKNWQNIMTREKIAQLYMRM